MKGFTRRDFFKVGGAGVASAAAFPLLQGCGGSSSTSTDVFTIAVIPDTQNYSDGTVTQPKNLDVFEAQTTYLAQNKSALALKFVTHVGDVVEHGDGSTIGYPTNYSTTQNIEWLNATAALDILDAADIPFGLVPGNHDYDNMYYKNSTTPGGAYPPLVSTPSWWTNYFGSSSKYFKGKSWYGGASDSVGYVSTGSTTVNTGEYPTAGTLCNYGLSSYQLFTAGGKKFLHISLEMEAGDAAIAWAQTVIDAHPKYATIVTTHSFLAPPAWGDNVLPAPQYLGDPASYNSASYLTGSPNGYNGAQNIWNKLIAPNNQIFMVLCGHSWTGTSNTTSNIQPCGAGISKGENIRIDPNNSGNPVYQILSDYQGNTVLGSAGGDGWLRIMQFDMASGSIYFYTINAWTTTSSKKVLAGQSVLYTDEMSDFDQPEAFSDFTLSMPVQVLNAPKA